MLYLPRNVPHTFTLGCTSVHCISFTNNFLPNVYTPTHCPCYNILSACPLLSLTHTLSHPLSHPSLALSPTTHSPIHSLTHSLTHPFSHPLTHSSLTHSPTHSLLLFPQIYLLSLPIFYKRSLIQLIIVVFCIFAAVICAVTRVTDFHHHLFDVISGLIIGSTIAFAMVR